MEETNPAKICEVCGDDGSGTFKHFIATCSQCSSTHEHVYCMRVLKPEIHDDWICESCIESGGNEEKETVVSVSPTASATTPHPDITPVKWQNQKQKRKPSGKVKFIGEDEVIRLSSGLGSASPNFSSRVSPKKRRSRRSASVNRMFFPHRVQPCLPSRYTAKRSSLAKQTTPTSLPSRYKFLTNIYSTHRPLETKISPGIEKVGTSSKKIETTVAEQSTDLPLCIITAGINTNDVAEHDRSLDVQLDDLPSIKHIVSLYGAYFPSQDGTWKGGISIVESSKLELFVGFQARSPSKVRRQAYEISQKLPSILEMKMLPRAKYLVDLFMDGSAELCHIGLYFFPSDVTDRSSYNKLFERMEAEESVMIGYVDEVELIIFTSKQLKIDIEMQDFFWGIFRKPGKGKGVWEEGNDDMEIDMVGGEDVGRVDVVVRRVVEASSGTLSRPIVR